MTDIPQKGTILRAANGDVIGYDATGLVLHLSDVVIADIAERLAPAAPAPQQAPAAQAAPGNAAASVSGTVTLSAALLAKASPQDTVFIFARPANGGRVPLAAQRVQVKDLPYRFTLDDSKSMSPAALLSSSAQVVLGARISKSGDAIPQPGDLSGQVGPVALGAKGIALEINEVRKP